MSKARDSRVFLRALACASLFAVVPGCGSAPAPEAPPGRPLNPPQENGDLLAMMGDTQAAPPPAVDPKKEAEAKKLAEDFAKLDADIASEKARFDDKLKKDVAALVALDFKDTKAAVAAIQKGAHRKPGAAERDKWRHPAETLAFFGVKPTSSVLELDAGEGWYTELLAPLLAKKGQLAVTGPNPAGPMTERSTLYGKRLRSFLDKSPELGGKVDFVVIDRNAPVIAKTEAYDTILAIRAMHGWERAGKLDAHLAQCFTALKPGGVLGVVQHRAKADADPKVTAEKGYLPEKYVIDRAIAAGFKLEQKSEINANPKDTKDYADGVWALPPSFRSGEKDKYAAIGESDRMTLKLVKPKK